MPSATRSRAPAPAPAPKPPQRSRPAPAPTPSPGGAGGPLPPSVAGPISSSLGIDVTPVRVHSDAKAADASAVLGARAFAFGSHVFLGAGERPTDLGVMAHEVAHVVQQQGAGPRVQLFSGGSSPLEVEAHAASAAVVQQRPFAVQGRTQPRVQRIGIIEKARNYFADKAAYIPGFTMLTVIIGMNPISGATVERSPANILRGAIQIMPGGALITQALDNYGIVDKVANWVAQQIATLGVTAGMFIDAIKEFLGSLSLSDAFHLGDVWERAKRIFSAPIDKLLSFIKSLVDGIVKFIKDAILKPLAKLAEGTRAWDLLIAVLGTNPITGDPVPRTAETLIGGFMKLIGQEDIWQNMQRANAIPRAWAWFQGAMAALMGFVGRIPGLFISTLKSLELVDIILVPRAFIKVGKVFVGFVGEFISWGLNAAWKLLEIIFDVVSPGAFGYVKRTGAALKSILKNPLPFVGNLAKAAKLGFQNFASNFGTHLKAGLIDWLTGSLPGIYIPKGFSLAEIAKFVFSVLGLTWQNIRQKLVTAVGETAVKVMETGFDIVVALVKGGVAAAWEKIKDQLSNLKDMAIGAITDFVIDLVVKKAIPKLVSMFVPGAGFISAILSIYDMVMVFVNKIKTIIQVVTGFIDSIVAIAGGAIGAAAGKVEGILARLLSLAISFLAGFAGLGKVADKIMGIIQKIRAPIDKALDWLINFIKNTAKSLFKKAFGKPDKPNAPENPLSNEAKQAARVELAGKSISDPQDATRLITGVYGKLSSKGLKGLRVVYDPKTAQITVKAAASVVDIVAQLPLLKKSVAAALSYSYKFDFMSGSTVLHVFYDTDSKPYPDVIENDPGIAHAEQLFARSHLATLKSRIAADRAGGRLKTPVGQRVPVVLELNRLPCPICAPILAGLAGSNPDLQFSVRAASASNAQSAEITMDYIEVLLGAGVEVSTVKIYDAILTKITQLIQAAHARQIKRITGNEFDLLQAAIPRIKENISKEKALADMIAEAKKRQEEKKKLATVPPVGSGV